MCCHPSLTPASAIALTLRAVGGLTTAEIARASSSPRRRWPSASRARSSASRTPACRSGCRPRRRAARRVARRAPRALPDLQRGLRQQRRRRAAPRRARRTRRSGSPRMVHRLLPDDAEVAGLLALMLLIDAQTARADRRRRRARPARRAGPLALGPRARSPRARRCSTRADRGRARRRVPAPGGDRRGPRPRADGRRHRLAADPRAVRPARADDRQPGRHAQPRRRGGHGRRPGRRPRAARHVDGRLAEHYRVDAVRATCSSWPATRTAALALYRVAARRTTSLPEQRYLARRAARLAGEGADGTCGAADPRDGRGPPPPREGPPSMAWRRGEVWLDLDVLWFREPSQGLLGGLAQAGADAVALPELPRFGQPRRGSTRRVAAGSRRRRRGDASAATRTVPAVALVLGSATMLPIAALRAGRSESAGPLHEDPPSLTFRVDDVRFSSGGAGRACGGRRRRVTRVDRGAARRSSGATRRRSACVLRPPGRRHAAPRRGARLGHLEPRHGQQPRTCPAGSTATSARSGRSSPSSAGYRAAHPDAPRVVVGDISLAHGGRMDEHVSHQNGSTSTSTTRGSTGA